MNIDQLIETHFNSSFEEEILNYFNYQITWRDLPLVDERESFWSVSDDHLYYQEEDPLTDVEDANYCVVLLEAPTRKGDYVLIAYDTQCDGNKYLGVFRADKECKDLADE